MDQEAQLRVRISDKLKRQLEQMAAADRRKLSNYVRLVLEDHVEKNLKERKK